VVTALAQRAVQVSCQTPEYAQLPRWLAARAKQHQLQLDDAASQLLCYCYEGNLLALAQALERLALLWPDGKLTLPRVEQAVNDAAHFTPYHWVDALLAGKSKRVLHLQQLRLKAASRRSCCVRYSGAAAAGDPQAPVGTYAAAFAV
jgi:DNA polymerase-3 subunit delta